MNEFDIANFADEMINEDLKKLKSSNKLLVIDQQKGVIESTCVDVSQVQIGDDITNKFLEQGFGIKIDKPKVIKEEKQLQQKDKTIEDYKKEISIIIEEFKQLTLKTKKILEDLSPGATTTGNIGVNMAGPGLKKKNKNTVLRNKLLVKLNSRARVN